MRKKKEVRTGGHIHRLGVFIGHLVVNSVMFLAIMLVAAGTGYVADWVATWCNDQFMLTVMQYVDRAVFLLDVLLYVHANVVAFLRALTKGK